MPHIGLVKAVDDRDGTIIVQKNPWEILSAMVDSPQSSESKNMMCYLLCNFDETFIDEGGIVTRAAGGDYIESFDFIAFDLDYIDDIDEILSHLSDDNIAHLAHTTWSHGSTAVSFHHKLAKDLSLEDNAVAAYSNDSEFYAEVCASLPNPYKNVTNMRVIREKGSRRKAKFTNVVHCDVEPVKKWRVIVKLDRTYTELGKWKYFVHSVAKKYNLPFDAACAEKQRLMFVPSFHPDRSKLYSGIHFDGEPIVVDDVELVDIPEYKGGGGETYVVQNKSKRIEYKSVHLPRFLEQNPDFDIVDFYDEHLSEVVIKDRPYAGKGIYIDCPNSDEHSSHSDTDTYIVQHTDSFVAHCSHNSCPFGSLDIFIMHLEQFDIDEDLFLSKMVGYTDPTEESEEPVEESEEPVEDAPIPAKDDTPPIDTKVDAKVGLKNLLDRSANTVSGANDVVQFVKKHALDRNVVANAIGKCKHLDKVFVKHFTDRANRIEWLKSSDILAFDTVIKKTRAKETGVSYEEALYDLVNSWQTNSDKETGIDRIASTYMVSKGVVRSDFKELSAETVNSEYAERFSALTRDYCVVTTGAARMYMPLVFQNYNSTSEDIYIRNPRQFWEPSLPTIESASIAKAGMRGQWVTLAEYGKSESSTTHILDAWAEVSPDKTTVKEFIFDPKESRRLFKRRRDDPNHVFNLWNGYPKIIKPIAGDLTFFDEVYKEGFCQGDEEQFNFFMTWLADMMQNPGKKQGSSLILGGTYGIGKSSLFDTLLPPLMGNYIMTSNDIKKFLSKDARNSQLAGKILLHIDEGVFSGDKQMQGGLRNLISMNTLDVNEKYKPEITIDAFFRVGLCSNFVDKLVTIEEADRRFSVFSPTKEWENRMSNDVEYFTQYFNHMTSKDGLRALLHRLLTFDPRDVGLTWESLRTPYKTDIRAVQVESSMEHMSLHLINLMKTGHLSTPLGEYILELDEPINLDEMGVAVETAARYEVGEKNFNYNNEDIHSVYAKLFFNINKRKTGLARNVPTGMTRRQILDYLKEHNYISQGTMDRVIFNEGKPILSPSDVFKKKSTNDDNNSKLHGFDASAAMGKPDDWS